MAKNTNTPALFDFPDYSKPAEIKKTSKAAAKKTQRRGKEEKGSPPGTFQPFLPGLSRRGRPRSPNPVPATVRASESRKRRLDAGMKRIELLVSPEIAVALERLSLYYRVSRVEMISRLIAKAAKRIPAA
jgi:hypothetical protein